MENDNRLLDLMNTDQEILGKILATESTEDALAIAKESILDYTTEELEKDLKSIKAIIYGEEAALDIDELEAVVGGAPGGPPPFMNIYHPAVIKDWGEKLNW